MATGGLLDFLKSAEGQGLLSMVAVGLAGSQKGTPWNNLGRAGMGGLAGYGAAQSREDRGTERADAKVLRDLQIGQIQSGNAEKAAYKDQFAPGTLGPVEEFTPPTFGGQEIDPKLAALGPHLAPKDMYAALGGDAGSDTSEIKNYKFGQKLPEADRVLFSQKPNAAPSSVQEFEYLEKLRVADKADNGGREELYFRNKRASQFLNLGGTQQEITPTGKPGAVHPVTPKIEDTAPFRANVAGAVAEATAGVTQGTDTVKKVKTADNLLSQIDSAEAILSEGDATGSLLGAGVAAGKGVFGISDKSTQANQRLELISGWMVSNVPRMEGPQSNFDIANYKIMAAVVGDKTKPEGDRLAALAELRILQDRYKAVQSGAGTTPKPKTVSLKDIADTAKASGKTTKEVTEAFKAQGYKIGTK